MLVVCGVSGLAAAQDRPAALIHPIYGSLPGSAHDDRAAKLFAQTVGRYRLGPVETMDLPRPPAPQAASLLRVGMAALEKLKFAEAETALDAAVAEVTKTGGAGLESAELADLFLHQAIAAQHADWKELAAPVTQITPPKAREAYLRAAVLAPGRTLAPRRYPPLAIASFALATAEVKQRPRGNLVVRAPSTAEVIIDAGAPLLAPATATTLAYGDHFVRVEDIGRKPWAAVLPLFEPTLEIDTPPTELVVLDDREAAARARRMGATFALIGQLKNGPALQFELRLVDTRTGERRDSAAVPFLGEAGPLDAAVMRLDEEARRLDLMASGSQARLPSSDLTLATVPMSAPTPSRSRRSLFTAIGVAVSTAIVLGIAVSRN